MDESPAPGTLPDNYEAVLSWKLDQNKRQVNILQIAVVLLTPLAALTALSVLGMGLLSGTNWVALFAFYAALNASGAIGDMWMTALALRYPRAAYVVDKRDGMEIFLPQPGSRLQ